MGKRILKHVKSCSVVRKPQFEENIRHHRGADDLPLSIVMAGSGRWGDGAGLQWQSESDCSVELVTMGNAALSRPGFAQVVKPGGVYFVHAGSRLNYRTGPSGMLHKRFVVIAGQSLEPLLRSTGLHAIVALRPAKVAAVASLMRRAARLLDTRVGDWEMELSALAYSLLAVLARGSSSPYPAHIRRALDYMEHNLGRGVVLSEICSYAGVSEAYFSRLFRRSLGSSPMHYFQKRRMEWAQRLLTAGPLSIKEIAVKIGFEDPLYFSAQFKKVTGLSPSAYRSSIR